MSVLASLQSKLQRENLEALLITTPANVRYVSGFTSPADGRVVVTQDSAVLITDGRYIAQANEESTLPVDIISADWHKRLPHHLGGAKLAVEAEHVTLSLYKALSDALGYEPVSTKQFVQSLRLIKTNEELAIIRDAAAITDKAFSHILNYIKAGEREIDIALELEWFMRKQGAEGVSFETVVASGVRSAMPHGVASDKRIEAGELVTLDFGAKLNGYCADMTRTVAVGDVREELRSMYAAVLDAQVTSLEALGPGKSGKAIDALAHERLASYELDEYFTHGLGHGVGLDIHEGPRLSSRVDDTLAANMTITVEPGVYIPGNAGVRIEDLAFITESGYECVSHSDKAFIQL